MVSFLKRNSVHISHNRKNISIQRVKRCHQVQRQRQQQQKQQQRRRSTRTTQALMIKTICQSCNDFAFSAAFCTKLAASSQAPRRPVSTCCHFPSGAGVDDGSLVAPSCKKRVVRGRSTATQTLLWGNQLNVRITRKVQQSARGFIVNRPLRYLLTFFYWGILITLRQFFSGSVTDRGFSIGTFYERYNTMSQLCKSCTPHTPRNNLFETGQLLLANR